jgi:hypothetical protein
MSGLWFGVPPRTDTKETYFGLRAQNMITILGSIMNIIIGGKGDLYDHFNEHKILDFNKE